MLIKKLVKVGKNSWGIIIPKPILKVMGIDNNGSIKVSFSNNILIIEKNLK